MELCTQFSVASVRDLAWVLASPGLLDPAHGALHGCVAELAHPDAAWLRALDADPRPP